MTNKTKQQKQGKPMMPTINYTDFINRLARERARRHTANAEPHWLENNPNFEEDKFRESLHFLTEDLAAWQALGNHYADVLESPGSPAKLHNVIVDELEELVNQADLYTTSPEMLRLIYPLLRFRAAARERKEGGR